MSSEPARQIVLASGNAGKLRELRDILAGSNYDVVPQSEFNIGDAVEDGLSFVENAILKARHAAQMTGLPAIADDSGIEVDALNGEPGIHSARYAGEHGVDDANNRKLLREMEHVANEDRTARFRCVIAYMRHAADPMPLICPGTWEGRLLRAPHGDNGFGYDPLFYVESHQCSSAELSPALKNRLSHRGQALAQLKTALGLD